ncbi:MAG: S49 family peptidase [Methylococcaceae bacterium]
MSKTTAINLISNGAPWAITADMMATIISVAERTNDIEALKAKLDKPLENTRQVTHRNGVAVIPISGPIFPKANLFSEISGATSIDVLSLDFNKALNDSSIKSIVLDIDSPGGAVAGINEFSNMVRDCKKPITAYVGSLSASAAYWISSACDQVVIDATASIGNVGIVTSRKNTDDDIIEIVSSRAEDKRPDPQTDKGRAVIQEELDHLEDVFLQTVAKNMGKTVDQIASYRGRSLVGKHAVKAGFANKLGSLESVIAQLSGKHSIYTAPSTQSAYVSQKKAVSPNPIIKKEKPKHDHNSAIRNYQASNSGKLEKPCGTDAIENYQFNNN